MSSLKELKRKAVHAFGGGDGESEIMDRQFLEADRKILESLRSDELPAHTRATVMNAPGTVRLHSSFLMRIPSTNLTFFLDELVCRTFL